MRTSAARTSGRNSVAVTYVQPSGVSARSIAAAKRSSPAHPAAYVTGSAVGGAASSAVCATCGLLCWGRLVDWVSDSRLGLRLMAGCTARTSHEGRGGARECNVCKREGPGGLRFLVIW